MSRLMAAIAAHRDRERAMDSAIPGTATVPRPQVVGAPSSFPSAPSPARMGSAQGQAPSGVQPAGAGGHFANAVNNWRSGNNVDVVERPNVSPDPRINPLPKTPGMDRLVGLATAPAQNAYRGANRDGDGQSRDEVGGPSPGGGMHMEDPWDAARRLLAEEEARHSGDRTTGSQDNGTQNMGSRNNSERSNSDRDNGSRGWNSDRTSQLLSRFGAGDSGYKNQASQISQSSQSKGQSNVSGGALSQSGAPSQKPSLAERSRMAHSSRSTFSVPTSAPTWTRKQGQTHGGH